MAVEDPPELVHGEWFDVAASASHRALMDTIRHGLVILNPHGRIEYANRAVSSLLGCSADDLRGRDLEDFFHPGDREAALAARAARRAGVPAPGTFSRRLVRGDGELLEVLAHSTPLLRAGELMGFLVEYTDVSELAHRDRDLASALAEESILLETTPMPVVVIDDHGQVLRANHATEQVFGWPVSDLVGREVGVLAGVDDAGHHGEYLRQYLETGDASTPEGLVIGRTRAVTARRRDGSTFPGELTVAEVATEFTVQRRFVGVVQDLTERRRIEEQLLQSQKSESLGRLVAGVAHDFNNFLTAIGGSIELAQGHAPEADRWLGIALANTDQAALIVRRLLQYARRESTTSAPVDLLTLAEEMVVLMQQTVDRRVTIDVQASQPVPPVVGDRAQLQQVFMNLVVNARDAVLERISADARGGGGHIHIGLLDAHLRGRAAVAMRVADDGTGMPPEIARRVFDPFFTTKSEGLGTGLGLSMVYGIVQNHGGTIAVESTPGQGTSFTVTLPVAATDASTPRTPDVRPVDAAHAATAARVLVVDDEADIRRVIRGMLQTGSYDVVEAASVAAALEAFRPGEFELVLLDLNMPDASGWTALDLLRTAAPDQRILIASGYCSAEEAHARGATGLLQKPFQSAELLAAVRDVLSHDRKHDA